MEGAGVALRTAAQRHPLKVRGGTLRSALILRPGCIRACCRHAMWLIVDARILLGSVVAGEFFASLLGLHPAASQAFRCCRHRLGIRAKRSSRLPSVAFFRLDKGSFNKGLWKNQEISYSVLQVVQLSAAEVVSVL